MNCQEVREMLTVFIDGEAQREKADMIRKHLTECKECSREHELLCRTAKMLSAVSEIDPPAELLRQIEAATVGKKGFSERVRIAIQPMFRLPAYAKLAAATAVAAAAVSFVIGVTSVQQPVR